MYLVKPGQEGLMALVKMLGLPKRTKRFEIHFDLAAPVLVRAEYFPDDTSVTKFLQKAVDATALMEEMGKDAEGGKAGQDSDDPASNRDSG